MTNRPATIVLVASAGFVLAACGSDAPATSVAVDESAGRIGSVSLGDSRAEVIRALGKPGAKHTGFAPLGEWYDEIGGPPSITTPGPGEILRYRHFATLMIHGRVYSMIVTGAARTMRGLRIGDRLDAVRRAYAKARCSSLGSESRGPLPYCIAPVAAGSIAFGLDPVKSITLTRPGG